MPSLVGLVGGVAHPAAIAVEVEVLQVVNVAPKAATGLAHWVPGLRNSVAFKEGIIACFLLSWDSGEPSTI